MPGANPTETSEGSLNVSAGIDDAFRWNVRPSDKEPRKRWAVLVGACLIFLMGLILFGNVLYGVLGFAIIVGSTAEFWHGTSYKLDKDGASARCFISTTQMHWNEVKRAVTTPEGIKLSPLLTSSSRMNAFRGVFLRFGADSKQQILDFVRRSLPADVGLVDG